MMRVRPDQHLQDVEPWTVRAAIPAPPLEQKPRQRRAAGKPSETQVQGTIDPLPCLPGQSVHRARIATGPAPGSFAVRVCPIKDLSDGQTPVHMTALAPQQPG